MKQLPWNAEALPIVTNLKVSQEIIADFAEVTRFENATPRERPAIQFKHLLAVANYEQGVILQPLIYENKSFAGRIDFQRLKALNWATPSIELAFSHACSSINGALKSVGPEVTELESLEKRIAWIVDAAGQFHSLMQRNPDFMEQELATMAGWLGMPDKKTKTEVIKEKVQQVGKSVDSAIEKIR